MNDNIMFCTSAHLGFSEGKVLNFRKGQSNLKQKRKAYKSYIGNNFLRIRSCKIGYTYDCR